MNPRILQNRISTRIPSIALGVATSYLRTYIPQYTINYHDCVPKINAMPCELTHVPKGALAHGFLLVFTEPKFSMQPRVHSCIYGKQQQQKKSHCSLLLQDLRR